MRDDFLEQSGASADLCAEVKALLSAYSAGESELERTPYRENYHDTTLPGFPSDSLNSLEGYKLLEELHRGGQGVVYRAVQESTNREVALKFIHAGTWADKSVRRRFEREVELAGSLKHSGIVRVYDSGLARGQYYYVIDYIDGHHLDDYATQHRLTHRQVLELFVPICDAVNHAHQHAVMHRDLKPSNILVDHEGQPHVVDFGLAKLGSSESAETLPVTFTGQVMGTLNYMSPEQASGQSGVVDIRSDVYSLCVILYQLLTGHLPYDLSDSLPRNLLAIQTSPPMPMKSVDHELTTIVLKGLSKEAERRYQTAGELGNDIKRFLRGESIEAKRDSVFYLLRKTIQRHRIATTSAILVAVTICLSTVVGWGLYLDADLARNAEVVASRNYQHERDVANELRAESQRQLYFAKMNLAGQVASELFGTDTIRAALEPWIPGNSSDVDLRGWEWYYLHGASRQEEFQSEILKGWTWEADYNPDGSEYVVAINGWGFQIRNAADGRVLREHFIGSMRSVDWSADGATIATGNMRGEVGLFDAQSLQSIWKRDVGIGKRIAPVRMSPDGKQIAVSSLQNDNQRFVLVLDASNGSVVHQIPRLRGPVNQIDWSHDSSTIAISFNSGPIVLWNTATGELVRELNSDMSKGSDSSFPAIRWRSDGVMLAGGSPLRIWNIETGEETSMDNTAKAAAVAWHPRDCSLACAGEDGVIRVLDCSGRVTHEFTGHTNSARSVRWSPSGRQLLSCGLKDRTVRTWHLQDTDRTQVIGVPVGSQGVNEITWSPDGRSIAFTRHWDPNVEVWDVHNRERVSQFKAPARRVESVAFSPDGRQLAWTSVTGAHLLDLSTQTSSPLSDSPDQPASSLSWHPSGRLAVAFREPVARVMIWESNGAKKSEFYAESGIVTNSLAWNATGNLLAMVDVNSGVIYVWDIEQNEIEWQQEAGNVQRILWSADGKTLVTSLPGAIVVRDAKTGVEIERLNSIRERFGEMDYSREADRLAIGSPSSLSLWDIASGQVAIKFMGNVCGKVQWSPDGRCVAAGCLDGLYLWDAARGYELSNTGMTSDKE